MKRLILAALAAVSLAGCTSMDELAQRECATLGQKPGTAEYAACWQRAMARRQSIMNAAMMSD